MDEQSAAFLGKGFAFPLRQSGDGELVSCGGEEAIRQSVYTILMTRQGERAMRPDFGSRIWDYVFLLPGETVRNQLCGEITRAVTCWERRVDDVTASVDLSSLPEGKILVTVDYRVRSTNHPGNLVFPFYLEEGRW